MYVEFVKIYELEFEEFLLPLHTILVGGIFVKWHYYCWLYLLGSRILLTTIESVAVGRGESSHSREM